MNDAGTLNAGPSASSSGKASAQLTLLLLPGLDGTGCLLESFVRETPAAISTRIITYPRNEPLSYSRLESRVSQSLPDGRYALLAESFSGPLAMRLAARQPRGLIALILVATFARSPVPSVVGLLRAAIGSYLFRCPCPQLLIRRYLVGEDAPPKLILTTQAAIRRADPGVLATRLRQVLAVDAENDFASSRVPTLYVRGTRDRLLPRSLLRGLRSLRPDLECAELDAPHFVLQRQPAAAAKIVAEFSMRSRNAQS
jgi:pimeloyl-[acyl-carrier protein] methyl ester esterase